MRCADGDEEAEGEQRSLSGSGLDLVPELEEDEPTVVQPEYERITENTAL